VKQTPQISRLRRESRAERGLRISELIGDEQRLILLSKSVVGVELRPRILVVEQWSLATCNTDEQCDHYDYSQSTHHSTTTSCGRAFGRFVCPQLRLERKHGHFWNGNSRWA
jgi:hypothetical protein